MDPDQALADIRDRLPKARKSQSAQIVALAESIDALDGWMSSGGFSPAAWRPTPGRPQLTEAGDILLGEGVVHGKPSTYNQGCRCLECRAANRDYKAQYRAANRRRNSNGNS